MPTPTAATDELTALVPLPPTVVRLVALVDQGLDSVEAMAAVIADDDALSERLRALSDGSLTPEQAARRLGPGMLATIALAGVLRPWIQDAQSDGAVGADGSETAVGSPWRHAVAAALTVELAQRHCARLLPAAAIPAAFLHDLGKLRAAAALARPGAASPVPSGPAVDGDEPAPPPHFELSARLATAWGLSPNVVSALANHHRPLAANGTEARLIAYLIALADAVCARVDEGCGEPDKETGFDAAIAERLGIGRRSYEALCGEVSRHLDELLEQLV